MANINIGLPANNPVSLKNLIPSPTNWTKINCSVTSDGEITYFTNTTSMVTVPIEKPISGHIYYGCSMNKTTSSSFTYTDNRFEVYNGDGDGLNWVYNTLVSTGGEWVKSSSRITVNAVNASDFKIRSFVVNASETCYRKNHMLIDLTACFGSGNEPSKEWCDSNIPFFIGTTTVTQTQVIRRVSNAHFVMDGVARKIRNGYTMINGAALLHYRGNTVDFTYNSEIESLCLTKDGLYNKLKLDGNIWPTHASNYYGWANFNTYMYSHASDITTVTSNPEGISMVFWANTHIKHNYEQTTNGDPSKDPLAGLQYVNSGTNTYTLQTPVYGNRLVYVSFRAGGMTTTKIGEVQFNVNGTYHTLQSMVRSSIISSIFVMSSCSETNNYEFYPNFNNIYTGGYTDIHKYPQGDVMFQLAPNCTITDVRFYSNVDFDRTYDGLGVHSCSLDEHYLSL